MGLQLGWTPLEVRKPAMYLAKPFVAPMAFLALLAGPISLALAAETSAAPPLMGWSGRAPASLVIE
jgi:hypothetical protein